MGGTWCNVGIRHNAGIQNKTRPHSGHKAGVRHNASLGVERTVGDVVWHKMFNCIKLKIDDWIWCNTSDSVEHNIVSDVSDHGRHNNGI